MKDDFKIEVLDPKEGGITVLDIDGLTSIHIDFGRNTYETGCRSDDFDSITNAIKNLFEYVANHRLGFTEFDLRMAVAETRLDESP